MGMAASQARFLGLTARKSNNEYQAQQINHQRLNLADNQTQITQNYQEKMNNRMLLFSMGNDDNDGNKVNKQLSYWDIVMSPYESENSNYVTDMTGTTKKGMGYRIVDVNGNIIVPNYPGNTKDTTIGQAIDKYKINEDVLDNEKLYSNLKNGNWVMKVKRTDDDGNEYWNIIPYNEATFITEMRAENPKDSSDTEYFKLYNTMIDMINGKYQELSFKNLTNMEDLEIKIYESAEEGAKILVPEIPDDDKTIHFGKYMVDEKCVDPAYMEEKFRTGEWFIQRPTTVSDDYDDEWMTIPWQGIPFIQDVYNTEDDKAAEAEYNYLISKFQKQDKMLQLRLQQLETEHKALETELDSISKTIEKNINNSFKTFA